MTGSAAGRWSRKTGESKGQLELNCALEDRGYDGDVPQRFSVHVAPDKFDELCRPSNPVGAIAELIWNGLDAEASKVEVVILRNDLGGIEGVRVEDDGHGMTNADAVRDFSMLGGSWKRHTVRSRNHKRALHGKRGQGRFRAFALGVNAEWDTSARGTGGIERTKVTATLGSPEFVVSDPEHLGSGRTGTTVTLTGEREGTSALEAVSVPHSLVVRLAAYLTTYPDVRVVYNGHLLDPQAVLVREERVVLADSLGGAYGSPVVRIMEWRSDVVTNGRSSLVFCDENGVELHEMVDHAPGRLKLTAYVQWPGFREFAADLLLGEMGHPILEPIVTAAREATSRYAEARAMETRRDVIARWKERKVYPYPSPARTPVEVAARRVFDLVAATAAPAVPPDTKGAKLSLRLIKEALERSPDTLHTVLREVLELTPAQLADFEQLLRVTSLSSIIATTKLVVERLEFLDDLQSMVFSEEGKKQVKERQHLHEILANNRTWVFGEQYTVAVSDRTLTRVVEAHLNLLGKDRPVLGPIRDLDGNPSRRVDLMLARASRSAHGARYLVVELKRPKVTLRQQELTQITRYASALARTPDFMADGVRWDFWLVGDDYDEYVHDQVHQEKREVGVAVEHQSYTVRVRRWADVIEENKQRLHFYQEHLTYESTEDQDIEETLRKYLPVDGQVSATGPGVVSGVAEPSDSPVLSHQISNALGAD